MQNLQSNSRVDASSDVAQGHVDGILKLKSVSKSSYVSLRRNRNQLRLKSRTSERIVIIDPRQEF